MWVLVSTRITVALSAGDGKPVCGLCSSDKDARNVRNVTAGRPGARDWPGGVAGWPAVPLRGGRGRWLTPPVGGAAPRGGATMKAVAYAGEGKVRLEERSRPELLEPTDAILRVTAAALCGTDLHLVEGKMPGFEEGVILGHEFVGVVEEAGDGLRNVEVGQRYVASMQTACGGGRATPRARLRRLRPA